MKNKLFLLSTIATSFIAFNQLNADHHMHPYMPSGGGRPCYPSTMCTGDPNLMGGNRAGCDNMNPNYRAGNAPYNYSYGQPQSYQGQGYLQERGYREQTPGYRQQNPGYGAPTGKLLQTNSTETFKGVIKSINRVKLPDQTQVQIVLSTQYGDLHVIVGPAQFIERQKIGFKVGDKIEVLGYRIKANGNEVITAAQIKKNGNTLDLLDEKRQPMWDSQKY